MEAEIVADIDAAYATRPGLAMVDSDKGITNLHVPSDVIIDASMPNVVRDGGQMWNKDDKLEEVKCVIPDRSYSTMYDAIIKDCQKHGQFDWTSTGHVSNVGLMAQKAEEYGSHDKTFEIASKGTVVVTDAAGNTIFPRRQPRRHLQDVPDQGRPHQGLDQAVCEPSPCPELQGHLLAQPRPCPRRQPDRLGPDLPEGARHHRTGHRVHDPC